MPPLSDPTTETFALSLPSNGNGNDVDAGLSPKKNSGFLGAGVTEAKSVACVVASESSIEISFDNSGSHSVVETKKQKPPKMSKKDKKQLKKDETPHSQTHLPPPKEAGKRRGELVIYSATKNKNKKVAKHIIKGGKNNEKKKKEMETETETEEERDQALAAISTSRSRGADEEHNNAKQASTKNKDDLQVITEEELNQTQLTASDVLSPLQRAQAAMAALALSPQRRVNGFQTSHTNTTTTNNNTNSNNSESDESEDDDDDDMIDECSIVLEEHEHEADFRSSPRGRGANKDYKEDEPGVLVDAVEGFMTLIGLGDPVCTVGDDPITIQESKKESKKSRTVSVTSYRRKNNRKKNKTNVKGKGGKVTTAEEGDDYISGTTAYFLSGPSRRGAGTEPAISKATSSSSNQTK
jgi:hypothetical protein